MMQALKSTVKFRSSFPFMGLQGKAVTKSKAPILRNMWRMYQAAKNDRLTSDWNTSSRAASSVIKQALPRLRDRARDLAENNDYFKRFLRAVGAGVIGANGFKFQNKAKTADGESLDKPVNDDIEEQFRLWSRAQTASVTRMKSFVEIQRLALECCSRDGEIFIHEIRNFPNEFGYALQIIEADLIDDQYDDISPAGNLIRMGIEFDKWGAPLNYYVSSVRPGDDRNGILGENRTPIPASEIIHLFIEDRPNQVRGVPWGHTAMRGLHMLEAYLEAELVSARLGAAKMGWVTSPEGEDTDEDEEVETGEVIEEFEPGIIQRLPVGTEYTLSDPKHPAGNFPPFIQALLKGIAAGLNIAYTTLSNDLSGVNFSSMRGGLLDERDRYMQLQEWFKDHFLEIFWPSWFDESLLRSRFTSFDLLDARRVARPHWQGRRWPWIDPVKDAQANVINVNNGFDTRSNVIRESGKDPQEVAEELEQDSETFDGLIVTETSSNGGSDDAAESNGDETDGDETNGDSGDQSQVA